MRVSLPSGYPPNLRQFLMRCGYASHYRADANRLSFVRRISGAEFPRFHLYIEQNLAGQTYFNLHLDQKPPSYPGAHAHNADYRGKVVEAEGNRLYRELQTAVLPNPPAAPAEGGGFWQRLFGGKRREE